MIFKVYIQPGAKKNEIAGRYNDAVKIRLTAPPVEGKANEALIKFLSDLLNIPKSKIAITHGLTSRHKLLSIDCQEGSNLLAHLLRTSG